MQWDAEINDGGWDISKYHVTVDGTPIGITEGSLFANDAVALYSEWVFSDGQTVLVTITNADAQTFPDAQPVSVPQSLGHFIPPP